MIEFGLKISGMETQKRISSIIVDEEDRQAVTRAFRVMFPEYSKETIAYAGDGIIMHIDTNPIRPLSDWAVGYKIIDKR